MLLDTILSALLPMVVTFLLGFVAAWRHDFGSKDASTLNRMVLVYAVPLALFAGTVTTSRTALSQDIPLVIALRIAIVGLYGLVFVLSRCVFLGYEKAAQVSLKAYREDVSLRQAALKLGLETNEQFDDWVRPEEMTHPLEPRK